MPAVRVLIAGVICLCAVGSSASTPELQLSTATISGVIADETGAPIAEAVATLTTASDVRIQVAADRNGRFSLAVPIGVFRLTISAHGFADQTISGAAAAGEVVIVPEIRLRLALTSVSIDVTPSAVEIADQQIHEQEQQRVFGIVPNFFVTFNPDAAPLNARQKFHLSWKAHIDPMQFAFVAGVAGVQQWRDDFGGFGDGAAGYARRYAAAYATVWTRSMITQVVVPTVFRQDPRYFYKGTGSVRSRVGYAISRSVIRKGDNRRWQPNYSGIVGSLASGAIANFYYPEEDRRGARLMMENAALGMVGGAIGHLAQEFLYARMTSRGRPRASSTP